MVETDKQFGLIGKPLSHSFSKSYFAEKFLELGLTNYHYDLYELENIDEFLPLLKRLPKLAGINVTIPYKKEVIPFLDELSEEARTIGAVNVIKIERGKLLGFNSDYFGFKNSLTNWLPVGWQGKALVLGTGGASLAVMAVLGNMNIPYRLVSRRHADDHLTYDHVRVNKLLSDYHLVINTTPLGMHPYTETFPDLDYHNMGSQHFLFDLVYNPTTTSFMKKGLEIGANVINGLEMLQLQAEKAWDIWTK